MPPPLPIGPSPDSPPAATPSPPAPAAGDARPDDRAGRKSKPVIALGAPQPAPPVDEPAPDRHRARWLAWVDSPPVASFLASLVFHVLMLLILAMLLHVRLPPGYQPYLQATLAAQPAVETLRPLGDAGAADNSTLITGVKAAATPEAGRIGVPEPQVAMNSARPAPTSAHTAIGPAAGVSANLLQAADTNLAGALDGRRGDQRRYLVETGGGSPTSEAAVERGLRWLMAHQLPSGAWRYDLAGSQCHGQCPNPGNEPSTTAATGMALLPFLGAGNTSREGEYQEVVRRGLYYLVSRAKISPKGADFQEGELGAMYSQGLATIALCEAYAMAHEADLRKPAQQAINFIAFAQDHRGGGWRYGPGQPGDITVTGWQLMALKCGQMAGLSVPTPTIALAKRFLDSVQCESGARYGYMTPQPQPTTTAIGLLMRMYTGWGRDRGAMYRGVQYLTAWGPSMDPKATNLYYDFYATQVLHHWGGPEWTAWNQKLRDYLVRTQSSAGHAAGSWHFQDQHGDRGGRLYSTAMAVMTLEVYYRYLPLYGRQSLRDDW
jgi:hypothetical protein